MIRPDAGMLRRAGRYMPGRFIAGAQGILHLPGPVFLAAIAGAFAVAGFLLAHGLDGLADFRETVAERKANILAPSPWMYRDHLPITLNAVAEDSLALWVVLRVDSLMVARDTETPCAILSAVEQSVTERVDIGLRYIALSAAVPSCAAQLPFETVALIPRAAPSATRSVTQGSPSMRWAILDGLGRSVYSQSDPPSPKEITDALGVLRGPPFSESTKR